MNVANAQTSSERRDPAEEAMRSILERQREDFLRAGPPDARTRIDRIARAIALLVDRQKDFCEALAGDFGHRSYHQTLLTDIAGSIAPLKHAKAHLRDWMKPEKRPVELPLRLLGARAWVEYQPLGVVGVIAPWNFPVTLTFAPLAGILAAGNRVLIKPSEYTPATSDLIARLIREAYDETEIAVVTGGPEVGEAFSRLPFDHLLFTGATSVARHVMRAAAENLVPVTLELGGKSPVIVGADADLKKTAERVMMGKTLNAGQICLAPDYALVPEDKVEAFASAAGDAVRRFYPTLKDNPDYTSVINQRHYDRLMSALEDARAKGGRIVELNPANEDFRQQPAHKIPPTLILNPSEDMIVMRDEIFGPLLPVKPYRSLDEAIDYVNAHPRPLGLYYFGADEDEQRKVLDRTTSGGVSLNDVMMHVAVEDLPFGGVGPSGMGAYHGRDGFRTFSHAKAVYRQATRFDLMRLLYPPFGKRTERILATRIKK